MDTFQHVLGWVSLATILGTIARGWYVSVWKGERGDDYNG